MASLGKDKVLKSIRQRKYLNKDFDGFRASLLDYARSFFADKINDFSEASVGGLLLDLAAYVGDVSSFYLDHQFAELDIDTAVEDINIERALRSAGVDIVGTAPATVDVTFYIEVPVSNTNGVISPATVLLPVIESNTVIAASNGVEFILIDDIDFTETKSNGELKTNFEIGSIGVDGNPLSFVLNAAGTCVSGRLTTETFSIGAFTAFRRIQLANSSVSEILLVRDIEANQYYGVNTLLEDVIYKRITNINSDNDIVKDALQLITAPYRYATAVSLATRQTTLIFGGGDAIAAADDIIPDPSEFAIPLYGKKTFTRFTLDPNKLLTTPTFGVAQSNTTLNVTYRFGGGLKHNVSAGSVQSILQLNMRFPNNPNSDTASGVRASTVATNINAATGGADVPTIGTLKNRVSSARNAQNRIVTKQDLLTRIYTLPARFGRIFRAAIRPTTNNPLTTLLFLLTQDAAGHLTLASDTLKENLATYLNEYRLISDSIDMLDSPIVNIKVEFEIITDIQFNKQSILQNVLIQLKDYFNVNNFYIDQPIITSDVVNVIYNVDGVIAVNNVQFKNIVGNSAGRQYSSVSHNVISNTKKGMLIAPAGGIFEVKFPNYDITGIAL